MATEDGVITSIKPMKGFANINFKELWQYRELLFIFTWRDLKVRYKQTVLGALWAIIPPVLTMIVFSAFFGNFAQMPSDGIPYPIFVFTGLLLWNYFSEALRNASQSLIMHQAMVQKIYFPRLLLPFSTILSGLVDFIISSVILLILMLYYGIYPTFIGMVIVPILVAITVLSALGLGLIFSAVNVKYRDIRYVIPFIIRLGLFVTPVIYPLNIAEGEWKYVLWLNPMTSVIENARAGLLGTTDVDWNLMAFSLLLSIVLFIVGLAYFKQVEKDFADVI